MQRLWVASLLLVSLTASFRVGRPPSTGATPGASASFASSSGPSLSSPTAAGFASPQDAASDFVAHFYAKDNLGIIFSADLRVTGFYKHRETGKMLPAEESGMIRTGDRILSINGAPIATLQDLRAAVASAEVPVHIKFRPPHDDGRRHQKTCSDFRFNITIYSSSMPRIDLTMDEFIVISSGTCCVLCCMLVFVRSLVGWLVGWLGRWLTSWLYVFSCLCLVRALSLIHI